MTFKIKLLVVALVFSICLILFMEDQLNKNPNFLIIKHFETNENSYIYNN